MNDPSISSPDPARTRLRETVAAIELQISQLKGAGDDRATLVSSFADLIDQLALGPEPEVRECPVCHNLGMRKARLCGYCWATLIPPTD